ncbi:FKBP-type peptidyl-prolyl cis-trans isomerase FkpA/FKBP-type peptidyl-prolyl cis-trans isomerase FklB [Alteromonadaceae bacterium 2753L.S.0a.02]|nr:FKBP-type peptidyl-prolyl cis-trans isomerase FkpA/FKBP-type peptidyl-prolyl cis-trans isomerase FklB [Alteromonadaceae bacterium 2753L.S.0a.02]
MVLSRNLALRGLKLQHVAVIFRPLADNNNERVKHMRLKVFFVVAVTSLLVVGCGEEKAKTPVKPVTEKQREAYAVGARIGEKVKSLSDEVIEYNGEFDLDMYLQGIHDTLHDQVQMSEEEYGKLFADVQKSMREHRREIDQRIREENLAKATAFLEENKTKEGVQVTESGLQYKVIKEGDGATPNRTDKVTVKYTGRLTDGSVFDTTGDGQPRQFQLHRVVKGWTEGLQLMKEGSTYEFYIPPALGYGAQDRSKIPPNSVLVFEIELLKTEQQKTVKKLKQ